MHPLREGWCWDVDSDATPVARRGTGIGSLAVYVDAGELVSEKMLPPTGERFECMFGCKVANDGTTHEPPPADIALAVLLASKGFDSLEAMAAALAGGDDYELLITVAPADAGRLEAAAARLGLRLTRIGRIQAGAGVVVDGGDGPLALGTTGFRHF